MTCDSYWTIIAVIVLHVALVCPATTTLHLVSALYGISRSTVYIFHMQGIDWPGTTFHHGLKAEFRKLRQCNDHWEQMCTLL